MKWITKILEKKPKPITNNPVMIGSAWLDKLLEKGKVDGGHERMDALPIGQHEVECNPNSKDG
jgi:hypothetical protein